MFDKIIYFSMHKQLLRQAETKCSVYAQKQLNKRD